jgi:multiple sugar transport system ATP-binding protein
VKPGPAVLGIRPEHIAVNAGSDWPFEATVPVEIVEPMGSDTIVWAKLGKQAVTMRVTAERAPAVGDRVGIGFDPINASLFAPDGNRL